MSEPGNLKVVREAVLELAGRGIRAERQGKRMTSVTLDVDSAPIEVHGHQPKAEWNGHYAARIYHPLITSIAETGDMLDARLRAGNVGTAAIDAFACNEARLLIACLAYQVSRPVPATEIAHVYEKQRTQARGVPWGAPVIRSLRDLDDYEVAELVRKKTEACVTAIVFGDDESQQGIAPTVIDADGNRVEQFEPGLIAYARGGKDIKFNQPSATGGYGEYKRASLHTISAGFRVPYELLTGDLSQVNYSSIRAGLVEFRRQIDAVQWQLFIPMFCAPVWRWFTEAAWAAGQIPSPDVPVEWSPPKFEAVDPQKDAMELAPNTADAQARTVEVVWSAGARVRRASFFGEPYDEELSLDPAHVRLERLNAGAPFLKVHELGALDAVIGSVVPGSARLENGRGIALVRISERDDVEPIWRDIQAGHIRAVSIGYR
jgi:hypothetical protein